MKLPTWSIHTRANVLIRLHAIMAGVFLAAGTAEAMTTRIDSQPLCDTYRWDSGGFIDVLRWDELGPGRLVAFDDEGWIRVLFPTGDGVFTAGQSIGVPDPTQARVRFEPFDGAAPIRKLVWEPQSDARRVASRVQDCEEEEIEFASGATRLAGTLLKPTTPGPHPALVLLHGSGAQDRRAVLPFARFLVREGIAILTFDKRGVGGSQGDWQKASFETLADDALAAVAVLRARRDIDARRIGLFGVSQGGWIAPLAAARSDEIALVVSVSGPGVTPAEQTLDLIQAELQIAGVTEGEVREAIALMRLALTYGRTGTGWQEYAAALFRSREREWLPYLPLPDQPTDTRWEQQRLFYHYDPLPALARLRVPVLALFGGRDPGIPADKNSLAWREALARPGAPPNKLVVFPTANHIMFDAITGSMYEIERLQRFVPEYRAVLVRWLERRFDLRGARGVVPSWKDGSR